MEYRVSDNELVFDKRPQDHKRNWRKYMACLKKPHREIKAEYRQSDRTWVCASVGVHG